VAAAATVGHVAVAAVAAPANFSQRHAHSVAESTRVFDTFERPNAVRAAMQVIALVAVVIAALARLKAVDAGNATR
jgi:hypothetical protein